MDCRLGPGGGSNGAAAGWLRPKVIISKTTSSKTTQRDAPKITGVRARPALTGVDYSGHLSDEHHPSGPPWLPWRTFAMLKIFIWLSPCCHRSTTGVKHLFTSKRGYPKPSGHAGRGASFLPIPTPNANKKKRN